MERREDLKQLSHVTLINLLIEAFDKKEQQTVNIIAEELAYRLYSPEKDYDKLLQGFGYAEIKEEKPKIKHMGMS